MRAWLLTWNPDKWHWEDYEKDCEKASKEKTLDSNWSSQSKQAQFLRRQLYNCVWEKLKNFYAFSDNESSVSGLKSLAAS